MVKLGITHYSLVVKSSCYFPSLLMTPTGTQSGSQSVEVTLVRVTNILLTQDYALHSMEMIYVCKSQCKMQDVCKVCSISVQDVCNVCARCVQGVLNMCARCMHMSCLISLNPTHLENIAHVGSWRNLKNLVES